jgi:hypothetical protein
MNRQSLLQHSPILHPLPEPETGTMNAIARLMQKAGSIATPYIATVRIAPSQNLQPI